MPKSRVLRLQETPLSTDYLDSEYAIIKHMLAGDCLPITYLSGSDSTEQVLMVLFCHLLTTKRPNHMLKILLKPRMIFLTQYCKYVSSIYVEMLCLSHVSSFP